MISPEDKISIFMAVAAIVIASALVISLTGVEAHRDIPQEKSLCCCVFAENAHVIEVSNDMTHWQNLRPREDVDRWLYYRTVDTAKGIVGEVQDSKPESEG
ncbi:hypothetical protein KAR91_53070 [Candidatus Pacearchaeota archaeon]|nr:hypothetical protein [Candidatus Pacearchaeota archaeon]